MDGQGMGKLIYSKTRKTHYGFTLIELMVSLVLAGIVSTAVYRTFNSQHKSYIVQERKVEMNQTLRTALLMMEQDIMMAGFSHSPKKSADITITHAADTNLRFSMDNHSGGIDHIDYNLYDTDKLRRTANGAAICYNVDVISFAYAVDADHDRKVDIDPVSKQVIWAVPQNGTWFDIDDNHDGVVDGLDTPGGTDTAVAADVTDIRAVRVWVLVHAGNTDQSYTDPHTYYLGAARYTPDDHFRRILGCKTIYIRNMGL